MVVVCVEGPTSAAGGGDGAVVTGASGGELMIVTASPLDVQAATVTIITTPIAARCAAPPPIH